MDARYEKARMNGWVVSHGVLLVSAVRDGTMREILAVLLLRGVVRRPVYLPGVLG